MIRARIMDGETERSSLLPKTLHPGLPPIEGFTLTSRRQSVPGNFSKAFFHDIFCPSTKNYTTLLVRLLTVCRGKLKGELVTFNNVDVRMDGDKLMHTPFLLRDDSIADQETMAFALKNQNRPGSLTLSARMHGGTPFLIANNRDRIFSTNKIDLTVNLMQLYSVGFAGEAVLGYKLAVDGSADMNNYISHWEFKGGTVEVPFEEDGEGSSAQVAGSDTVNKVFIVDKSGVVVSQYAGVISHDPARVEIIMSNQVPLAGEVAIKAKIVGFRGKAGDVLKDKSKYMCTWKADPQLGSVKEAETGFSMEEGGAWVSENTLVVKDTSTNIGMSFKLEALVNKK